MESILRLEHLETFYDKKKILKDVSFEAPSNKITAIIGPSGCGKTTLLKSINRMVEEELNASVEGDIFFDGENIKSMPKNELRKKIGLVFQVSMPFPFSIYKNMTYAPKYYGTNDKKELDKIVREKLEMAGLYDEIKEELHENALNLSGGQQQRLCIARALSVDPTILMLDEPCSALDIKSIKKIEDLLLQLKEQYTIIIVTHNIAQAKRISDYTLFMEHGKVIEFAPSKTLFSNPQKPETAEFLRESIS